jgi:hypothetical protein
VKLQADEMVEIPRVTRAEADKLTEVAQVRRRPIAHVLTIYGYTTDGPTYGFECRADARDLDKTCAAWVPCEHELPAYLAPAPNICMRSPDRRHTEREPGEYWHQVPGCAFAYTDAEDTDDAVRDLAHRHELRRGSFLVEVYGGNGSEVILTLLGEIGNVVGSMPTPEACSVRPTRITRYPGYGPEVELRELIEEALSEDGADAVVWDDDHAVIVVDADRAAKKAFAWFEDRYDVPPDQQTLPLAGGRPLRPTPPGYTTSRIASVHPIGDRL